MSDPLSSDRVRPDRIRGSRLGVGFGLAVADLLSPPLLAILGITVALNLALLAAIWFGSGYILAETTFFTSSWLEWLADAISGLGTIVVTLILFPAFATIILSFFLDSAAAKVARRHYPWLPAGRDQPIGEMLAETIRFLLVVIALNVLAMPIYFLVPAVNIAVFYLLNGYLYGREYFELVAVRYLPGREARAVRKRYRFAVLLAGVLITLGMTVPFLNLVVPLWAVALMVHMTAGMLPDAAARR